MTDMNWAKDHKVITDAYYQAINVCNTKLNDVLIQNKEEMKEIRPLIDFVIDRIFAVFSLTTRWLVWDAEIVLRSALETFVKVLFITSADEPERVTLLNEYWNDLSEILLIKQSEQAKKNLKHTSDNQLHYLAYSPQVLTEETESELRSKWPKSKRAKLEQKWSFTNIVSFLADNYKVSKRKTANAPLESIELLTHTYRMASHVTHGDETGILIIRERNSRKSQEREDVYIAHYLRMLSDCFYYCAWMGIATMDYLNLDFNEFLTLTNSLKEVQVLAQQYHMKVFDDSMYDKYRNSSDSGENISANAV